MPPPRGTLPGCVEIQHLRSLDAPAWDRRSPFEETILPATIESSLHPGSRWRIARLPVTWTLLGLLSGVSLLTGTHLDTLSARWLATLGMGSADLYALELGRLVTSAVSTHGGAVFWRAMLAVLSIVGAAELVTGSRRTAFVFGASHLITLVALAVFVIVPLPRLHPALADSLYAARDVGPSAGYFGCLALLCATLPQRLRRLGGLSILAATGLVLVFTLARSGSSPAQISAAMAHAVAFPTGWLLAHLSRRWRHDGRPLRPRAADRVAS